MKKRMIILLAAGLLTLTGCSDKKQEETSATTTPAAVTRQQQSGTESINPTIEGSGSAEGVTTTKKEIKTETTTRGEGKNNTKDIKNKVIGGVYAPSSGDIQIQITEKEGSKSYSIKGDGMKGDAFGEFSGELTKKNDTQYEYINGDNRIRITVEDAGLVIEQYGTFGDGDFTFDGFYTKIRDVD